ncbi:MAG: Xaa-Pro peptidase family protein [Desulfoplanes sp.]
MPFTSIERLPLAETQIRTSRLQGFLNREMPQVSGIFIFSRLNIYYLTGSWVNGVLWVPSEGEPTLMCRRGIERARLDSPLHQMAEYRSFTQLPEICADFGTPLGDTLGVEMGGLPWNLGLSLQKRIPATYLPADPLLSRTRAVKTDFELAKMREAGAKHHLCLYHIIPECIHPGMNEREISLQIWNVFLNQGHCGMMRMENFGEEIFLGHVAAGENANYPSVFNGPVGVKGVHPVIPHMGNQATIWNPEQPLIVDCGFCLDGYHSDKTQVYWSSKAHIPEYARKAQDFCLDIQMWIAERLRPGAIPSELFAACWKRAEKQGFMEEFMGLGKNKVQFIGHGIGLAIDEHPVIARGFDAPLEEGMTMALEPKIGISGLGMVGVENTFEITRNGGRCLSGDMFNPVLV